GREKGPGRVLLRTMLIDARSLALHAKPDDLSLEDSHAPGSVGLRSHQNVRTPDLAPIAILWRSTPELSSAIPDCYRIHRCVIDARISRSRDALFRVFKPPNCDRGCA